MAGCCSVFQRWLSLFLYMVGLTISGYSYYVSMAKKADENYVALCDIDETISCSKVFTSKYGKGSNVLTYILWYFKPIWFKIHWNSFTLTPCNRTCSKQAQMTLWAKISWCWDFWWLRKTDNIQIKIHVYMCNII